MRPTIERTRAAMPVLLMMVSAAGAGVPAPAGGGHPPFGGIDPKCGLESRLGESGLLAEPRGTARSRLLPAARAELQAERVIGLFRFRFDTAGAGAPAMLDASGDRIPGSWDRFVDSAGRYFNDAHAMLTGALGYADPIQPGQGPYEVNIVQSTFYGETVPGARIGTSTPARFVTHINIDNDFRNFYSEGMDGLRVTAAHEFFHAVQFGSYGYWSTDVWFMEATATWMEEVLHGDVDDYHQYLRGPPGPGGFAPRGHFARPDFSLLRTDGITEYSRAILGIFLEARHSASVIRRAWELVPSGIAITALDGALAEAGTTFREAFLEWARWNAQTGPDADTAAFYSEGREYPRIVTAPAVDYVPPSRAIADTIGTTSVCYHPVRVGASPMSVIVANLRTSGAPASASFRYLMADEGDQSFKRLSNGLHVKLEVPDPANWATIETAPPVFDAVTAAPNPYRPGSARGLRFHIPRSTRPDAVRLTVLGAGLDRFFEGIVPLREDLSSTVTQVAEWDGRGEGGREIPSGVYVFILRVDGAEHTGKLAVVR